ncbi:MAG: hypothetical protein ACRCU0_07745 [Candidatus Rhabdochlamydia sp.]
MQLKATLLIQIKQGLLSANLFVALLLLNGSYAKKICRLKTQA